MKSKIFSLILSAGLLTVSCSDFTDLKPKGMNMLEKTSDLEMLLNYEYGGSAAMDLHQLMGDIYYAYSPIPTTIKQAQKTRTGIIWSYDEAAQNRMAELTASDSEYEYFYGKVGKICNPIISMVDASDGDAATKAKIKGEAYAMRAWCEFMAVNKFAKAYNPQTAATTPGVAYVLEDWNIQDAPLKLSVAEVYDLCLADIDAAIATGGLPEKAVNTSRFSLGAAYALKAIALTHMQQWDKAAEAANQALKVNNTVIDYWGTEYSKQTQGMLTGAMYDCVKRPVFGCPEDYFSTHGNMFYLSISKESAAQLEDGSFIFSRLPTYNMMYDFMFEMLMGTSPTQMLCGIDGYDVLMDLDFDSDWNYYGFKTSQMYLILAEAAIHSGDYDEAMAQLDAVRAKRIDPAKYAPLAGTGVSSEAEAMFHLKQASRAENFFTCWNFMNQKRWNQIPGWEDTISHKLGDETYTLRPDSKLWIFPFPKNVCDNNPNMTQNYEL